MGYCFMTTQKIKTLGNLAAKQKHNLREIEVANADPARKFLNAELVSPGTHPDGSKISFVEAWKEKINKLPYYQDHRIRKNAVRAIEVITTFSRSQSVNLQQWKEQNVRWLKKTFDVAPNNESNVLSVVYHADESGNVHCHAIVIPIDERGRLNASRFLDGSKTLSKLQTSYAQDMKQFGLERGLQGSVAKHKDIKRYYAELNRNIEYPEMKEGEKFADYTERVAEHFRTRGAAQMKEINDRERRMAENITNMKSNAHEEIQSELSSVRDQISEDLQYANEELSRIEKARKRKEQEIQLLEEKKRILRNELTEQEFLVQKLGDVNEKAEVYDQLYKKIQELKVTDPEHAERIINEVNAIMAKDPDHVYWDPELNLEFR